MNSYGKSISIELHGCDSTLFTRKHLKRFVKELCVEIDMVPAKLVFWDYKYWPWAKAKAAPHLKGTSLVQFIQTSSIVIHTLDDLKAVYIDLFSCGDFDSEQVVWFAENYFNGQSINSEDMERK